MAKKIMIQGTMSNAGKSLFVAALCRIFMQDGYKVAPFKSQNMALNSFITKDGLEMGRAQVMQAEAAGIEPDVSMNPILLKPTTDVGSQVIVNGEVIGNMKAKDYFKKKLEFVPAIKKAFNKLESEYDIIVIEGAGSPAELNLKADDIVNMGLAKMLNAPVLLVGDIDRGGVFAQLIGTVKLLEKDEEELIKGLVVNKFRGDISLFKDGVRILEDKSEKKVVGVVPYIDVDIEDEDSLSNKLYNDEIKLIDIVVIGLPKISNFTDFDVFNQFKNVSVRYVRKVEEWGNPDMVIIPGTKSTILDCKWLIETGIASLIKKAAYNGIPVFGICGGYQILGKMIKDPHNTESGGECVGLGLLNIETTFTVNKNRTRVSGCFKNVTGIFHKLCGKKLAGYEIHMGITKGVHDKDDFILLTNALDNSEYMDGFCEGNVYGTYVHGIFDGEGISEAIVEALYNKKNLNMKDYENESISRYEYKQIQYNKLADTVRECIDLDYIYSIMK